ncbi:MAG: sulfite exporter TauE/SafE family protein [Bacteroidia bacterium]|nr:sulfite exporter TauE/SafE family protein [Bacteroidia bacterium]
MNFTITAVILGILGSFHCVGMCGPIALSIPVRNNNKLLSALLYNSGRVFTYSAFGFIFGLFGKLFFLAGLQQILSISIGVLILFFTLTPARFFSGRSFSGGIFSFMSKIKSALSKLFLKKNKSSLFLIGLLNGLLPCGLVYMAIAGAGVTGSEWKGALFMLFFGLGTFPVMLSVSLLKEQMTVSFRSKIRKAIPYMISVMAVMMILRGLDLGIPYVSPKINTETKTFNSCCEKKNVICKKPK